MRDQCLDGGGGFASWGQCAADVVPIYGTPRTVAGDAITTDANKCVLKPLRRADYPVTFTDVQWARLVKVFADGVCDYGRPAVQQQATIAWQAYGDDRGRVVVGGRPLGPPPRSVAMGLPPGAAAR